MIYPQNFEQKIGFDKVRILLKDRCVSILGEDLVDEMCFSSNYEDVMKHLYETSEMKNLLTQESESLPIGNIYDLRENLERIRIEGLFLDEAELFDLYRSLLSISALIRYFNNKPDTEIPHLKDLTENVMSFPQIEERIQQILDKFGKVKDTASLELHRIRREIIQTQSGIGKSLHAILRIAQTNGLVEKDAKPTMREGRLVIPISPAYKRSLKGIVHDESASGKTVYIEPAEVVENNNLLRELEVEERREITRILIEFSDFIRPYLSDLLNSYQFLATVDFIRSKALLAAEIQAILPVVVSSSCVEWIGAKHPLLFLSLQKQGKKIVPLDIKLDENQRFLIISGPNAGGKSVCLKTLGLLQYMLQCGMLVSVTEDSTMGIFSSIFIDIGDEQSIENDLSTYSSHLMNMKYFVKNATEKTLLLIDEFGGGTEPQIGGAIAEALLEKFNEQKAFGVITTHYTNLKLYASEATGIVNGAMLFDLNRMQPCFQLQIGNPGSSFAVEIARKIGLPENVILSAIDKVGTDTINYDKHLQEAVRDKRYWENKRKQIRMREKHIEELENKYLTELENINTQRKQIIRKAKDDASEILRNVNSTIENTISEIRKSQAEKEKVKQLRKNIETLRNDVNDSEIENHSDIQKKIDKICSHQQNKQIVTAKNTNETTFKVGDFVRIKGQTMVGEIISIQGKNVSIGFGILKSTVTLSNLEHSKQQPKKVEKNKFATDSITEEIRQRKLYFTDKIDIRGMRADEALQTLIYFIDDAVVVGATTVRILHGTGTGALRQLVRQYLSTMPTVAKYHDEHIQLGGAGITVVEFR